MRYLTLIFVAINLMWDYDGDITVVKAFHVYREITNPDGTKTFMGINSVAATSKECVIVLPDDGNTHKIIVRGFNGTVESGNSNELLVPTIFIPPPKDPSNLREKPKP